MITPKAIKRGRRLVNIKPSDRWCPSLPSRPAPLALPMARRLRHPIRDGHVDGTEDMATRYTGEQGATEARRADVDRAGERHAGHPPPTGGVHCLTSEDVAHEC